MAIQDTIKVLGQLFVADEIIAIAPSLGTFFTGVGQSGGDPVKNILLLQQLQANLGAAQIGVEGTVLGQLSSSGMNFLANLVQKEQGVQKSALASLNQPASGSTPA